jgi:U-box domain
MNPSFYCPLTSQVMRDPVVDADGNTYERAAITEWIRKFGYATIRYRLVPRALLTV